MNQIAIIGAGLSGRLLALNLFRHPSEHNMELILIDKENEKHMGPAYSAAEDYLLLNVPAEKMGAYSEDPEHFLKWVHNKGYKADNYDFLPRSLYREYIMELFQTAVNSKKNNLTFKYYCADVNDIENSGSTLKIRLQTGEFIAADKVVYAPGNFPPADPKIKNPDILKSKRYIRNPWIPGILSLLKQDDTVFLLGTGQTMTDILVILSRQNHKGKIIGISRHGYLPMVQKGFYKYNSFYEEIKGEKNVYEIFKIIRKHFDRAEKSGIDIRAVIDSLRNVTQSIWMELPEDEKRKFMRHLYRYWEIIRSRIPPQSEAVVKKLISSGQLQIIPGRVTDIEENPNDLQVHFTVRGNTKSGKMPADFIINCCGPESDYNKIEDSLVRNLMIKGLIRTGPANLGIDALADGSIIGKNGAVSDKLYTIGSPLRGVLFETIAVPEIRKQAEELARVLGK